MDLSILPKWWDSRILELFHAVMIMVFSSLDPPTSILPQLPNKPE